MPFFDSAGVTIHYYDAGAGEAVVLVHGFASNTEHNWGGTGWLAALSAKYRVIALDVRGHGLSDKPQAREAYGYANMGADVTRLMDHLGVERAILMGYSMGASIAIELMLSHPQRFRAIVLGGIAYDDGLEDQADRDAISEAYRADDPATIKSPVAKAYRRFAQSMPNDLKALAALIDADRGQFDPVKLAAVQLPVADCGGDRRQRDRRSRAARQADSGSAAGDARRPRPYDGARRQWVQESSIGISQRCATLAAPNGCTALATQLAFDCDGFGAVCA
jgi:pimeloyl-ACP methyl ester carboxylesterase